MGGFQAVTAVTITGAFVFGVVLALVGSLKLSLAKRLGIGETRVGGLLSALHLAFIPMMLLSGLLIDRYDPRWVLVAGCLLTAAAFYTLTIRTTYHAALASMLLTGIGAACVSTACVVLMPKAFFDGDPNKVSAALNLGTVFFALGSLVTPTLIDLLLRTYDLERFQRTMNLLAGLCLVPALVVLVELGASGFPPPEQNRDFQSLFSDTRLWMAGLVFFLYAPLEFAVGTWATTYLIDHGYSERRSAWLLSAFWLMFLAGRVLVAFLQDAGVLRQSGDAVVIPILGLLAAVTLGNLAGAPAERRTGLAFILLGLILGPIFPTLVGMVFNLGHPWGTSYGLMYAIGSLGSVILAPLIGLYVRGRSVGSALRIPMILGLLLAATATIMALI
jgi:fucose permease